MKLHQLLIGAAIFLTACSTPKYVYHFDHYDYASGKKAEVAVREIAPEESPLAITDEAVIASSEPKPVLTEETRKIVSSEATKAAAEKYNAMSSNQRKEFKKHLKNEIKSFSKKVIKKGENVDEVKRTKAFDTLVALAIVFGVAGIVLITLANISNAFWVIGAISLAIGAFLFVKWVANGNG